VNNNECEFYHIGGVSVKTYVGYTIYLGEKVIQIVTQDKEQCIAHMDSLYSFSNGVAKYHIQTWENGIRLSTKKVTKQQ
jgi:hypothetical protein